MQKPNKNHSWEEEAMHYICHDQINVICSSTNRGIQRARPYLCIRSESKISAADCEVEVFQLRKICRVEFEKPSSGIELGTRRVLVCVEGICK